MKFEGNPEHWASWPECEDLSVELQKLLAAAQDGGSTVSECRLAASRIIPADTDSWFREWTRLADANRDRAEAALRDGHLTTARSNWRRALNYYLAAAYPLDEADRRYSASASRMRACARQLLQLRIPKGEIVSIPWMSDCSLEGFFLPASNDKPNPVVVCVGEPQLRKEQYLYGLDRHAAERGLSLLAVDFFDPAAPGRLLRPSAEHGESAIGSAMDFLLSRDDVDPDRIAILADGCGSSFVARALAGDDRFAAAVCDGGMWDLQERAFLERRAGNSGCSAGLPRSNLARSLRCPVLITVGEDGWLPRDRVANLVERLQLDHPDILLKIFTRDETAASQAHLDNPTLANEFIFDWIASRLGISEVA